MAKLSKAQREVLQALAQPGARLHYTTWGMAVIGSQILPHGPRKVHMNTITSLRRRRLITIEKIHRLKTYLKITDAGREALEAE